MFKLVDVLWEGITMKKFKKAVVKELKKIDCPKEVIRRVKRAKSPKKITFILIEELYEESTLIEMLLETGKEKPI